MTHVATFPGTYAEYDTAHLLDVYEKGPGRIRRSLADLTDDHLAARPIGGKWSIREIVVHVADSEIMGGGRFRQTLAQSELAFAGYDQAVWANRLDYQDFDRAGLDAVLTLFSALRRTTSILLRKASPEDWRKRGRHPERGPMTLRQLLELYADHSERHLAQILERRALLGASYTMELLLPERLY